MKIARKRRQVTLVAVTALLAILVPSSAYAIVWGSAAKASRPWMAALTRDRNALPKDVRYDQPKNRVFCGGSLVATQWILTAVHCIADMDGHSGSVSDLDRAYMKQHVNIIIGREQLSTTSDGVTRRVIAVYAYPHFRPKTVRHGILDYQYLSGDVALLKLDNPVPNTFAPIPLAGPSDVSKWATGKTVDALGWGETQQNVNFSNSDWLRHASVIVKKQNWEHDAFSHGYSNGETCYGDSGGALVIGSYPHYLQVGVTSTELSGSCGKRAIKIAMEVGYTNKNPLYQWIANLISPIVPGTTTSLAAS